MTNSAATPIEDLVDQLVPPGMKVLLLDAGRHPLVASRLAETATEVLGSPTAIVDGWDIVVAVDVFRHRLGDDEYEKALSDILGALKPGGALVVYERNPYDDVDDNPPGTLARGILPIFDRPEVGNANVLGQEFFEHWCAAFWKHDAPIEEKLALGPSFTLFDRKGDVAKIPSPDGPAVVRILGWRDRAKFVVVERLA